MTHILNKIIPLLLFVFPTALFAESATYIETPYKEPQVVYDFYFNEPEDINSALYWVRSLMNTLMEEPYAIDPEMMDLLQRIDKDLRSLRIRIEKASPPTDQT